MENVFRKIIPMGNISRLNLKDFKLGSQSFSSLHQYSSGQLKKNLDHIGSEISVLFIY